MYCSNVVLLTPFGIFPISMYKREKKGVGHTYISRGKNKNNEWMLQGGNFQLDWTVILKVNEPSVIPGMKRKYR